MALKWYESEINWGQKRGKNFPFISGKFIQNPRIIFTVVTGNQCDASMMNMKNSKNHESKRQIIKGWSSNPKFLAIIKKIWYLGCSFKF